jgi:hypothetical protein
VREEEEEEEEEEEDSVGVRMVASMSAKHAHIGLVDILFATVAQCVRALHTLVYPLESACSAQ